MMTSSEMIKTTNEGVIKQLIMGQIQMTNKHQGINHQQVLYPNSHQFVRGDALAPPEGHNTLLKNDIRTLIGSHIKLTYTGEKSICKRE